MRLSKGEECFLYSKHPSIQIVSVFLEHHHQASTKDKVITHGAVTGWVNNPLGIRLQGGPLIDLDIVEGL